MIPVYISHDYNTEPVGFVTMQGNKLVVRMKKGIKRDDVHRVFGDCGYAVIRHEGDRIMEFEIMEFSTGPHYD